MFKKLRVRFTISTLMLLLMLIIILNMSLYFITREIFISGSKSSMMRNAGRIMLDKANLVFPEDDVQNEDFKRFNRGRTNFVVYNDQMDIIYENNIDNIPYEEYKDLVEKAYSDKSYIYENITHEEIKYRILTSYKTREEKSYVVQIFHDVSGENNLLNNLRRSMYIISLLSIFLLIFVSWFIAGKNIKPYEDAWIKQKNFLADVSHELRTPLTIIQTNLEVIKSNDDQPVRDNRIWIENAYSETEIMKKLLEELLMLAKIDSQEISLEKEKIDLSEIVTNAVNKYYISIKNNKMKLTQNIQPDIYITGDKARISQMISIFIDNSIKYSEPGDSVFVELKKENGNAVIIIKDTGIGINEEDLKRIFERFYRGDKSRNKKYGGYGLGLNIAKWIVDEHNGKISVESKPEEGTKIKVIL